MNQAIYEKLYITPDNGVAHKLAQPFEELFTVPLDPALTGHEATSSEVEADEVWRRLSQSWDGTASELTEGEKRTTPGIPRGSRVRYRRLWWTKWGD